MSLDSGHVSLLIESDFVFLAKYHMNDDVSLSVYHIMKHVVSVCPAIGHVDSDHLVNLGYCQVLLFKVCFLF